MGIRFSPGPCGCCSRVLFWINEFYVPRFPFVGQKASSVYAENDVPFDSFVPEINDQDTFIFSTGGGLYSGNIGDYSLIFWMFPYHGSPLPSWFATVAAGNYSGRIVVITGLGYQLSDVDFFNGTVAPEAAIAIGLNRNSFDFSRGFFDPFVSIPAEVVADPLTAGVASFSKASQSGQIFPGSCPVLSTGPNSDDSTEQIAWLAHQKVGPTDWVISGDLAFQDMRDDPGNFRFILNLVNVAV